MNVHLSALQISRGHGINALKDPTLARLKNRHNFYAKHYFKARFRYERKVGRQLKRKVVRLSADSRTTVGRLADDCRTTVHGLCVWAVDRLSVDCIWRRPTVGQLSTVGRQSTDFAFEFCTWVWIPSLNIVCSFSEQQGPWTVGRQSCEEMNMLILSRLCHGPWR